MTQALRLLAGIAISAVCVWISMRDVRLAEVWDALRRANYFGFLALMGLTVLGFWIRALRWRHLIASPQRIGSNSLFGATMIGFMTNNVLPFRLGEFVRPWALARREQLSKTTLLATIVVERAVDMLTLLAILGIALLVHPLSESTAAGRMTRAGAGVLVVACVGLTAFVVALERSPGLAHRVTALATAPLPPRARTRVRDMLAHFLEGLGLFRDLPRLLLVLVMSFLMFGCFALGLQVSVMSFGLGLPWFAGLVLLVLTAVGIMVPAAPGYIGTMHLACIAGMALFDVGKDLAVPFAWFYWAGQWLPVTVLGLWYLQREGLSLGTLGRAGEGRA